MIKRKCKVCGKDALLQEAGPAAKFPKYDRVFLCLEGHETILRNGEEAVEDESEGSQKDDPRGGKQKPNDLSGLERLNRFLDELEGKSGA